MFYHFLEFIVDYFTKLNARKIIGGTLVLIGLWMLGKIVASGDPEKGLLVAVVGFLIGGIGFVIIYYDMAVDKHSGGYDKLDTLTKAYEQQAREKRKVSTWHMEHEHDKPKSPDQKR